MAVQVPAAMADEPAQRCPPHLMVLGVKTVKTGEMVSRFGVFWRKSANSAGGLAGKVFVGVW